ncbi:MAG: hypothetical protein ACFFCQ_01260 [Promethearchaeota archaeon]
MLNEAIHGPNYHNEMRALHLLCLEFTGSAATRHSWGDFTTASGTTDQGIPSVHVNSTPSFSHLVEPTRWIFQPLVASEIIEEADDHDIVMTYPSFLLFNPLLACQYVE